jgi:hypothetical protein
MAWRIQRWRASENKQTDGPILEGCLFWALDFVRYGWIKKIEVVEMKFCNCTISLWIGLSTKYYYPDKTIFVREALSASAAKTQILSFHSSSIDLFPRLKPRETAELIPGEFQLSMPSYPAR